MAYCDPADLPVYGVNATALSPIPALTQQGACDAASAIIDTYFRDRYKLPLTAWGIDVRRAAAVLAVYDLLVTRGYNPSAGADLNIRLRYEDTLRWLLQVARQEVQADVTPTQDQAPGYDDPAINTSAQRGWTTVMGVRNSTKVFV
jgi:phage gp36-like protein